MKTTNTISTKMTTHPLENFLDIESGSTEISRIEQTTELTKSAEYDTKDDEIEETYQTIIDKAMTGYETLQDEIDTAEGKYIPRLAEVAATYLTVALNGATQKARLKEHKDKLTKKSSPKTVNNTIVMNREDLLKQIQETKASIPVEFKQIQESNDDKE